ncbi:HAD family hydrolase, partial [Streptomyces caeruleatus]
LADVDPAKVTLIEDLKTRYSVALCSNGNADFFKSISDKHNIHGLFPITVISSDEKTIKPDPEIYQRTLNRMQLPPEVV